MILPKGLHWLVGGVCALECPLSYQKVLTGWLVGVVLAPDPGLKKNAICPLHFAPLPGLMKNVCDLNALPELEKNSLGLIQRLGKRWKEYCS